MAWVCCCSCCLPGAPAGLVPVATSVAPCPACLRGLPHHIAWPGSVCAQLSLPGTRRLACCGPHPCSSGHLPLVAEERKRLCPQSCLNHAVFLPQSCHARYRYEKARKLKDHIGKIREDYTRNWGSNSRAERQVGGWAAVSRCGARRAVGRSSTPLGQLGGCRVRAERQVCNSVRACLSAVLAYMHLPCTACRACGPHATPPANAALLLLSCHPPADGHGSVLHRQARAACGPREGRG